LFWIRSTVDNQQLDIGCRKLRQQGIDAFEYVWRAIVRANHNRQNVE
jgi:hypothetical protein